MWRGRGFELKEEAARQFTQIRQQKLLPDINPGSRSEHWCFKLLLKISKANLQTAA
jgi:hypothetical protein